MSYDGDDEEEIDDIDDLDEIDDDGELLLDQYFIYGLISISGMVSELGRTGTFKDNREYSARTPTGYQSFHADAGTDDFAGGSQFVDLSRGVCLFRNPGWDRIYSQQTDGRGKA